MRLLVFFACAVMAVSTTCAQPHGPFFVCITIIFVVVGHDSRYHCIDLYSSGSCGYPISEVLKRNVHRASSSSSGFVKKREKKRL